MEFWNLFAQVLPPPSPAQNQRESNNVQGWVLGPHLVVTDVEVRREGGGGNGDGEDGGKVLFMFFDSLMALNKKLKAHYKTYNNFDHFFNFVD